MIGVMALSSGQISGPRPRQVNASGLISDRLSGQNQGPSIRTTPTTRFRRSRSRHPRACAAGLGGPHRRQENSTVKFAKGRRLQAGSVQAQVLPPPVSDESCLRRVLRRFSARAADRWNWMACRASRSDHAQGLTTKREVALPADLISSNATRHPPPGGGASLDRDRWPDPGVRLEESSDLL